MKKFIRSVYSSLFASIRQAYRSARGEDHRLLTHYILKINQLQDVDSIIYHASRCLHQMLDYQFFAFAMYDQEYNGGIDIWIDPKVDNLSLMGFIKKDFDIPNIYCNVHYFSDGQEPAVTHCDLTSMLSLSVMDGQTRAMLYIVPRRTVLSYHHELLSIMMKTIATALINFINLKKLENAALIDPLTRCYNRRALDGSLEHDAATAERYQSNLSIAMFDIDFFKRVNDAYGHRAGDAVLRAVSKSVLAAIRKSDYLARYGGEEFVLVLPATKFSKAIELAERLRMIIENLKINIDGRVITVTASFGVATYKRGTDKDVLLQKADEMLYEAKRLGRNRIKPDLKVYHRQQILAVASDEPLRP